MEFGRLTAHNCMFFYLVKDNVGTLYSYSLDGLEQPLYLPCLIHCILGVHIRCIYFLVFSRPRQVGFLSLFLTSSLFLFFVTVFSSSVCLLLLSINREVPAVICYSTSISKFWKQPQELHQPRSRTVSSLGTKATLLLKHDVHCWPSPSNIA